MSWNHNNDSHNNSHTVYLETPTHTWSDKEKNQSHRNNNTDKRTGGVQHKKQRKMGKIRACNSCSARKLLFFHSRHSTFIFFFHFFHQNSCRDIWKHDWILRRHQHWTNIASIARQIVPDKLEAEKEKKTRERKNCAHLQKQKANPVTEKRATSIRHVSSTTILWLSTGDFSTFSSGCFFVCLYIAFFFLLCITCSIAFGDAD